MVKLFNSIALLFICLVLSSCATKLQKSTVVQENFIPVRFTASIGGFLGTSYHITLTQGVLIDRQNHMQPVGFLLYRKDNLQPVEISPQSEQWQEFRKALDDLKVWEWSPHYDNPDVMDGTQWNLEFEYPDRSIHAAGSNRYPKEFARYLKAVQKLVGNRDFE